MHALCALRRPGLVAGVPSTSLQDGIRLYQPVALSSRPGFSTAMPSEPVVPQTGETPIVGRSWRIASKPKHSLTHKGDAYARKEMNDRGTLCAKNDIAQSESTNSWREQLWQRPRPSPQRPSHR